MPQLLYCVLLGASLLCQHLIAVAASLGKGFQGTYGNRVISYHYDAWSRLTDTNLSDIERTHYQYDAYGSLSSLTHSQGVEKNQVITRLIYIYNKDDSIRERNRLNGFGQQSIEQYKYDDENNLKDYSCSGVLCPKDAQGNKIKYQHDTFDAFNNIKTVASNNTITHYDYDDQMPARLVRYRNSNPVYPSSLKLVYDHNGNIIQDDQNNTIKYNPLNQTLSMSGQKGTTAYFYNGEGRQVGEVAHAKQTMYFIYGQANLLNTRESNEYTSFLYGANRLGKQDEAGTQYYLTDQGKSVVNIVGQMPNQSPTISSYAYSPYGVESALDQTNRTKSLQHFGFDGQLTDSQTNWQFLGEGYRAYNPILHRFMSQDSLSPFDQGGINGYIFSKNNPIMMSDPTGHMPFFANMGLGLVIGAMAGMLTSEMGGWGALVINALSGAVASNLDAIDGAMHGKTVSWQSVGIRAGIGAALGAFGGEWSRGEALSEPALPFKGSVINEPIMPVNLHGSEDLESSFESISTSATFKSVVGDSSSEFDDVSFYSINDSTLLEASGGHESAQVEMNSDNPYSLIAYPGKASQFLAFTEDMAKKIRQNPTEFWSLVSLRNGLSGSSVTISSLEPHEGYQVFDVTFPKGEKFKKVLAGREFTIVTYFDGIAVINIPFLVDVGVSAARKLVGAETKAWIIKDFGVLI